MTRDKLCAWLKLRQEEWQDGRWWVAVRYGRKVVGHYSDGALLRGEVVTDGFACGLMVGRTDEPEPEVANGPGETLASLGTDGPVMRLGGEESCVNCGAPFGQPTCAYCPGWKLRDVPA